MPIWWSVFEFSSCLPAPPCPCSPFPPPLLSSPAECFGEVPRTIETGDDGTPWANLLCSADPGTSSGKRNIPDLLPSPRGGRELSRRIMKGRSRERRGRGVGSGIVDVQACQARGVPRGGGRRRRERCARRSARTRTFDATRASVSHCMQAEEIRDSCAEGVMAEVFEEVRRLYVSFSFATSSCIEPEGPGVGVEPSARSHAPSTFAVTLLFSPPRTQHGALTKMLKDESATTGIRGTW